MRAEIRVRGLVQGVGFRPSCHRLATYHRLKGFVRNTGDAGVFLVVEGEKHSIEEFLRHLQSSPPPRARIEEIEVEWKPATGEFKEFSVVKSDAAGSQAVSTIPPEIAICDDCLREMIDPSDRRFGYPFITCVNCGPRFTIIEDLPYDREKTSMRDFPLCEKCLQEYTNPADRRYHAEPTCCPACGPRFTLFNSTGIPVDVRDPFEEARKLLDEGKVLVLKGLGGMHVATKTTEDAPIARLRESFMRPQQPFAVMARDLRSVESFAEAGEKEMELLLSPSRPIVLLKKSREFPLSELVSPGLDSVGVMLPYSGFHHLLFQRGKDPAYILTSANFPGLPMVTENSEAFEKLGKAVDYFLLHNRRIVNRCDDSVVRVTAGSPVFLRRSRGYAPAPIKLKVENEKCILGLGGELNVAAAVLLGKKCLLTQYIGDVSKLETLEYLREAVGRVLYLLKVKKIDVVACDLHPAYATTREAEEMVAGGRAELIKVQHHHAHLASLMAEHGVDEAVGIVA
ncbi:MAG: carbamoyltransferase HypF, partial [Candidatus Hadarchaeales archaeon]